MDQAVKTIVVTTAKKASEIIHQICKVGQYLLLIVFYSLFTILSYIFLNTLFKLEKAPLSLIIWFCTGIWVMFNIFFNYTMSVIVRPGTPQNLFSKELSYIKHKCKTCSVIKPPRTHHCSMCGYCVLQMDHHCPWIGQCVGHHNRSYFMNFITYTLLGLILIQRLMNEYMGKPIYRQDVENNEVSVMFFLEIYIFVSTLIVVLGMFSIFHWVLVVRGKTTLQCCLNDQRYTPSQNKSENVRLVFGTSNFFIIFLPNISALKHRGFYWGNTLQERNDNTSMIEIQHINLHKLNPLEQNHFGNKQISPIK